MEQMIERKGIYFLQITINDQMITKTITKFLFKYSLS